MRVACRLLLVIALLVTPALAAAGAPVTAQGQGGPATRPVPPDDPARGLVYRDLRPGRPDGPCPGLFEYDVRVPGRPLRVMCTHGPDPAPPGVDVRVAEPPALEAAASAAAPVCIGNGSDGYRVHVIYAHASDRVNRYNEYKASFVQWVAGVDEILDASAAETGASQRVRWLTDTECNPIVEYVRLDKSTDDDSLSSMSSALRTKGYSRSDRHYLVFLDATIECGISDVYVDDRADPTPGVNYNNGNPNAQGMFARVDFGCWGSSTAAHEIMHNLGAVQHSAPHTTGGFHCTDESDRLCYDDDGAGPVTMQQRCPADHEQRFDCNHDDYYHTSPPANSYLASHWNTANSAFLTPPTAASTPSDAVVDFDGNGTTDIAVFRPSTGTWFVRNGISASFGTSGDVPVPGDYDGNGTTDIAVFRPSTGTWFVRNGTSVTWGTSGDLALPLPSAILQTL
ncbi:MAG: hypothetical protein M3179_10750 [Actinomycetota bacterium]|nr:hypothetical protein [Actinomycetota bacterium]